MKFTEWLRLHGILVRDLAVKLGVSISAVYAIGKDGKPTIRTLTRVSAAVTELGAPISAVELYYDCFADERERAIMSGEGGEKDGRSGTISFE